MLTTTHFNTTVSGGADSQKVNKFVPADEGSIVIAMQEFPSGMNNFSNYSYINGVPHNNNPKTLREPDDINFIVLHETSGNDNGSGFQLPYTAHFVVLGDANGTIQQFNDLSEIEWHEAKFNNTSVGIEFVNLDWGAGSGVAKDSTKSQQLKEDDNYLWAYWGDGYNIYKIPPADRLERLVLLIDRLLQQGEDGFPSINPQWLQVVAFNDVKDKWNFPDDKIPGTEDEKNEKKFFVYSNGIDFMVPAQFSSGILSHNSVSSLVPITDNGVAKTVIDENAHTDGSFQSLYALLRIVGSLPKDDAYAKVKEVVRNNMFKATTIQPYEGWVFDSSINGWKSYAASQRRNIHIADLGGVI